MSTMIVLIAAAAACAPAGDHYSLSNMSVKPSLAQIMRTQTLIAPNHASKDEPADRASNLNHE